MKKLFFPEINSTALFFTTIKKQISLGFVPTRLLCKSVKTKSAFLLQCLFLTFISIAQPDNTTEKSCGLSNPVGIHNQASLNKRFLDWKKSNSQRIIFPNPSNKTTFEIAVHIIGNRQGNGATSERRIKTAIDSLNVHFGNHGIGFCMTKVNFINEDKVFSFCDIDDGYDKNYLKDLVRKTRFPKMFNIYFFPLFRNSRSNFPTDDVELRGIISISDRILLSKEDDLTHEMGHSFGLTHVTNDPANFMNPAAPARNSFNAEQVEKIMYFKETEYASYLKCGGSKNVGNTNISYTPWLVYRSSIMDTFRTWRNSPHNILKGDFNGDQSPDVILVDKAAMYICYGRQAGFFQHALPFQYKYVNNATLKTDLPNYPNLTSNSVEKKSDLLSFFGGAVFKRQFDNNGTLSYPKLVAQLAEFILDSGFRASRHIRLAGDIDGANGEDIIGIDDSLVGVAKRKTNGDYSEPIYSLKNKISYSAGWRTDRHPRLLGDVNGDGRMDLIGIGQSSVLVATGNLDGSFNEPISSLDNQFGYENGWDKEKHPRMIGDINGDGRADIIAFGQKDVYAALGQRDGKFSESYIALHNNFGYDDGWIPEKHIRLLGDVNGDGLTDIVAFGNDFVYISLANDQRKFDFPKQLYYEEFTFNKGWKVFQHPRLLLDIDGDGKEDIVGIHDNYAYILKSGSKFRE